MVILFSNVLTSVLFTLLHTSSASAVFRKFAREDMYNIYSHCEQKRSVPSWVFSSLLVLAWIHKYKIRFSLELHRSASIFVNNIVGIKNKVKITFMLCKNTRLILFTSKAPE